MYPNNEAPKNTITNTLLAQNSLVTSLNKMVCNRQDYKQSSGLCYFDGFVYPANYTKSGYSRHSRNLMR